MQLQGVKVHPPVMKTALDDPACRPFFAAAEELRMPMACHTGAHGWYLRRYLPILRDDIAEIRGWGLSEADEARVLGGNLQQLLRR